MRLKNIRLFNFRNYDSATFEFSEGLNCILGDNGVGKTNLLDAIHFLSLTKSAFASNDNQVLKTGAEELSLTGDFTQSEQDYQVFYSMGQARRKQLRCNDDPYDKLADHIGKFPTIMIHPHDVDYVRLGSEWRRRLFDGAISQLDHQYLEVLLRYNRIVKQRNQSLRNMNEAGQVDNDLLDTYDEQLFSLIPTLVSSREKYLQLIGDHFSNLYAELSDHREEVNINYVSQMAGEDFAQAFRSSRQRDVQSSRTLLGIHKDDFEFQISSESIKNYGSQGQQKSFMLALKLAQTKVLDKSNPPMLLLDDIFDRLDTRRITALLHLVHNSGLQVFITDARPDRVVDLLEKFKVEATLIYI